MKIKSKKWIERENKKEWRKKVMERDNGIDQMTGEDLKSSPHNCHLHHVLDKKNFPELRFDLMNTLTLSYPNHKIGKYAPHMNALYFCNWFKNKFPDRYEYLINYLKSRGYEIK